MPSLFDAVLFVGCLAVAAPVCWAAFWLSNRLTAQQCPACESQWRTELTGEWDGEEDWKCHRCGHAWGHRFAPPWTARQQPRR